MLRDRSLAIASPSTHTCTTHEIVGPEALKLGFKKTLVMTSGLRGSDIVHKISESLKYHGLEVVVYDKVESNPKDYNVMDAVALYQQNECDSFVSIGGGSSHDACKGARISAQLRCGPRPQARAVTAPAPAHAHLVGLTHTARDVRGPRTVCASGVRRREAC